MSLNVSALGAKLKSEDSESESRTTLKGSARIENNKLICEIPLTEITDDHIRLTKKGNPYVVGNVAVSDVGTFTVGEGEETLKIRPRLGGNINIFF